MKLIVACDPQGGIGYKNKLPWNKIQGDLPRFKKLTDGQIVVMGRNTWESLPKKPLPGRLNFVLTSQNLVLPNGAILLRNLNHFGEYKNVWLIGGASVINSHWHMVDMVHLTRTFTAYTCDTFIDLLKLNKEFSLQYEEVNSDHTYEIWARR
jgi:dihydrofolate reductase